MVQFLMMLLVSVLVTIQPVFAASITDSDGQVVEIKQPFSRIISLYPAHTENLFSLGLDDRIIGVSSSDHYPDAVKNKGVFSYREDAEKIIAAKPDLILIRPMISRGYSDLVDKLRQAGITVVSLQPSSVEQMYDYWRDLGELTGRQQQAEEMVSSFKKELDRITEELKTIPEQSRKKVYFESIHKKMKTFTPASITIFALTSGGGMNVAVDSVQVRNTNIAEYGKERILSHAGEIDVFLAQTGRMNRITVQEIMDESGFQAIKAVQKKQVHLVDETVTSRPTMRLLEGITQIRAILYPEVFGR